MFILIKHVMWMTWNWANGYFCVQYLIWIKSAAGPVERIGTREQPDHAKIAAAISDCLDLMFLAPTQILESKTQKGFKDIVRSDSSVVWWATSRQIEVIESYKLYL